MPRCPHLAARRQTLRVGPGMLSCLINAINMANANGEANTITLRAGTYTLAAVDNNTNGPNSLPSVTSVLTIKGARGATTILERDVSAPPFRVLNVAATGMLTLHSLTLRNGFTVERGGNVSNSGTLTLIDCILTKNRADFGGGLFNNNGTVIINRTTFEGNQARLSSGGLRNGLSFPPSLTSKEVL